MHICIYNLYICSLISNDIKRWGNVFDGVQQCCNSWESIYVCLSKILYHYLPVFVIAMASKMTHS